MIEMIVAMIDMKKIFEFNKATKIFFVGILFLFLVSIIASKKDPDVTVHLLGVVIGALMGFIYMYGMGRLEIHTEEKYDFEGKNIWKRITPTLKIYFAILFSLPLVTLVVKNSSVSHILFPAFFGAIGTYLYFYGTKKIKFVNEKLDI